MWVATRPGRPLQHWAPEGETRALCGRPVLTRLPITLGFPKCEACLALEPGVPLGEAFPFVSEPFKQEAE